MRQRWLRSLALSLGFLVMGQGTFLRAEPPAPLIQPYPPVEIPPRSQAEPVNESQPSESAASAPATSLERPIALDEERPVVDHKIQPTGLFSNNGGNTFAFSPAGSFPVAQPMPAGPNTGSAPLPMPAPVLTPPQPPDVPYSWRQPATTPPASQGTLSAPVMSMPGTSPGTSFGTASPLSPGTSFGTAPSPLPPGSVVSPGVVAAPGVVTGPMGAPLVDGGGVGNDCCAPGCCPPDCCMPGCCTPGCCQGMCCDGCCGWGNGCCFGNRWYASAEYLLWFIRGDSLPPLLTAGPLTAAVPGALGQPGTTILYGNNSYQNNPYSGVRLRGGYWFGDCHGLGLDVGGFILGGNSRNFSASSIGSPILTRPFFNVLTGLQDTELVAGPGLAGTFSAVNTFFLYGAEANLRRNFFCGCNWFIDGFAGWRLLGLNESLSMTENLAAVSPANPAALPAGSTFLVNDRFATSNLFNGGQIGAIGEYRLGRWSFDLRTSVGVGGTMQFVNVSGSTTSAGPGILPTTAPGGLLALSSNIGPHTRSMVSFIEEVGLNVGYQFTNHIRGFVGYNFLFWSNVVRPGQQIDVNVNTNLLPPVVPGGPNRPAFAFNGSNFWVEGIQFGIDIRW